MPAARSNRIRTQFIYESSSGKQIISHRCIDMVCSAGNGGNAFLFLMEAMDRAVRAGLNSAKFSGELRCDWNCSDGHIRVSAFVKLNHVFDIHAINMVCAEDGDGAVIGVIDQTQILKNRIRGSSIPGLFAAMYLGRRGNDELVPKQIAELPAV